MLPESARQKYAISRRTGFLLSLRTRKARRNINAKYMVFPRIIVYTNGALSKMITPSLRRSMPTSPKSFVARRIISREQIVKKRTIAIQN